MPCLHPKDHIFNLEAESDEPVHNRSLLQIPEDPFTAPFLKDKGAKVKKPCKKEALPNHTLGTADSMPIPVAMQHPLPQNPPVTSTTATITVTITHLSSTSIKAMEPDPAPDMPRIFIPGTRDPDMEDVKAPSTTLATTSRKPSTLAQMWDPVSTKHCRSDFKRVAFLFQVRPPRLRRHPHRRINWSMSWMKR